MKWPERRPGGGSQTSRLDASRVEQLRAEDRKKMGEAERILRNNSQALVDFLRNPKGLSLQITGPRTGVLYSYLNDDPEKPDAYYQRQGQTSPDASVMECYCSTWQIFDYLRKGLEYTFVLIPLRSGKLEMRILEFRNKKLVGTRKMVYEETTFENDLRNLFKD